VVAVDCDDRLQVEGVNSPLQLALSLLRSLKDVPALARSFSRGFLPGRKKP